jgi:hypothetical protein
VSKYSAQVLQGTLLEDKDEKERKGKGGFLDPWSSLIPDYTREKLSPDFVAYFKDNQVTVGRPDEGIEMPYWGLLFPKRSYLPPDYPHLQMWFLGRNFAPSLQFIDFDERKDFEKGVRLLVDIYQRLFDQQSKYEQTKLGLAINATPFSFIKNDEGKYFAGGQSVRTFHLHFLGVPQDLETKELTEKEAVLVYPTKFSHLLLKLIFNQNGIRKFIFDQEIDCQKTDRGVRFSFDGEIKELIAIIGRLDELMYQVQLSLIYSFYQDSEHFLDKLADFARTMDLEKMEKELDELILLGYERSLPVTKDLVNKELHRLGRKFGVDFDNEAIDQVCQSLTTDDNEDLSSWLGEKKVVLRPGMGYGTMVWVNNGDFEINIVPIDSMESEGTMESNGYVFSDRVKVDQKPEWLDYFLDQLASD